ncbi:hypothetical protein ACFXEB_09015 [Aerococcus urinaeequi]
MTVIKGRVFDVAVYLRKGSEPPWKMV